MQLSKKSLGFVCSTIVVTVTSMATVACQDDGDEAMATGTDTDFVTASGTTSDLTGTASTTLGTTASTGGSETGENTSTGSTTGVDPTTATTTSASTGSSTSVDTGTESTSATDSADTGSTSTTASDDTGTTTSTTTGDDTGTTADSGDTTSTTTSDDTGSESTGDDDDGGKLGTNCMNENDCASDLVCAELLPMISTCSECGPKKKCDDPAKNLCSPTWNLLVNKNPFYICVAPKSLGSGSVCLPDGSGPAACKEFCVEVDQFKSLGVCGECRPGESDCPAGEECTEPSFSGIGFVGSKCKAL